MFAEPALGGRSGKNIASVSWFTPRPGAAVSFDRLGATERAEAEEQLRQRMDRPVDRPVRRSAARRAATAGTGCAARQRHLRVNGTAVLDELGVRPTIDIAGGSGPDGCPLENDAQPVRTATARRPGSASASSADPSKAGDAMTIRVASAPARAAVSGSPLAPRRSPGVLACGPAGIDGLLAGLGVRMGTREAAIPPKDAEALLEAQEALNRACCASRLTATIRHGRECLLRRRPAGQRSAARASGLAARRRRGRTGRRAAPSDAARRRGCANHGGSRSRCKIPRHLRSCISNRGADGARGG